MHKSLATAGPHALYSAVTGAPTGAHGIARKRCSTPSTPGRPLPIELQQHDRQQQQQESVTSSTNRINSDNNSSSSGVRGSMSSSSTRSSSRIMSSSSSRRCTSSYSTSKSSSRLCSILNNTKSNKSTNACTNARRKAHCTSRPKRLFRRPSPAVLGDTLRTHGAGEALFINLEVISTL